MVGGLFGYLGVSKQLLNITVKSKIVIVNCIIKFGYIFFYICHHSFRFTRPKIIAKDYNIVQEKSIPGKNFKEMHIVIQQIKSALRTIQTHVKKQHLQKYLDEYFYRLIVRFVKKQYSTIYSDDW